MEKHQNSVSVKNKKLPKNSWNSAPEFGILVTLNTHCLVPTIQILWMPQRQTKGSLFKISRVSNFSKQNVNKKRKSSQEVTTAIKLANTKVWGSLVSYNLPKIGKIIYPSRTE